IDYHEERGLKPHKRTPQIEKRQTRKNPSPRDKTRLSLALHQPTRFPGNAYCDCFLDLGCHGCASAISFSANLWRLSPGGGEYNVCACSDMQFGVQQCIFDKQSNKLGILDKEYSLSSLERYGTSSRYANVLPVVRMPIQAAVRDSLGHWDYSRRRHDNRGLHWI